MPALTEAVPRAGVYLGVGPEQNFTYIAAIQPRLAFIIDIRRDNMIEHLMYKALFELSADRAEFISRLLLAKTAGGSGNERDRHYVVRRVSPDRAQRRVV